MCSDGLGFENFARSNRGLAKALVWRDGEDMNAATILVGTASWQEPDFIEFWYPKGLPKTRLLEHYAEHFSFVEVNGSFYGIPLAKTVEQWCHQTPDNFIFDVKLHRLLSRHATEAKFLPPDLRARADIVSGKVDLSSKMEKLVAKRFLAGVQPLIDAKKLGAFLLQLSPSFQPRANKLDELENVLGLFAEFPVAVELRNRFWLTGSQTSDTVDFFKRRGVTLVSVDAPEGDHFTIMPNVDFMTSSQLGYLRAHGRNVEAYTKGKTVQARFDYDYNEEELLHIAERVVKMASQTQAVHAVMNNNRRNFAPKAALKLRELIAKRAPALRVLKPFIPQDRLL